MILIFYQHFRLHRCQSFSMHQLDSFIFFCAVSTFKESFQIPLESTSSRPYFQFFLRSSIVQNIVSDSVRMHRLAFLISNFLSSSDSQNIVSNSVKIHRLASSISTFSQQFHHPKKNSVGGRGPQPRSLSYFELTNLPTLRPWSQTLQVCTQDG